MQNTGIEKSVDHSSPRLVCSTWVLLALWTCRLAMANVRTGLFPLGWQRCGSLVNLMTRLLVVLSTWPRIVLAVGTRVMGTLVLFLWAM